MLTIKDNDTDTFRAYLHASKWRRITEGMEALYTIEVDPAPTGPLTINMQVSQSGDFGASGAKSVTVTQAETTYRVSTTDDVVNESNGSVSARVMPGHGYVPGWPSNVSIDVADNDDP